MINVHGAKNACLGDRTPRIDVMIEEMLPRRKVDGFDRTFCMALSKDDSIAFTGQENGMIYSWPLKPGSKVKQNCLNASIERIIAIGDDRLALLAGDGSIYLLHAATLNIVASRASAHQKGIFTGFYDDIENILVTGGLDGWIRAWKLPALTMISEIRSSKHGVLSLALAHDNGKTTLVAGNVSGRISLFSFPNLSLSRGLKAHAGPVFSIKNLAPGFRDDDLVISAGSDGTVALWSNLSRLDIDRQEKFIEIRSGQAKLLDVLPIVADHGRLLIWTAGADGSVGAWSLSEKREGLHLAQLGCFQVHERTVEQLVYCARSTSVFSIASDGSMQQIRF